MMQKRLKPLVSKSKLNVKHNKWLTEINGKGFPPHTRRACDVITSVLYFSSTRFTIYATVFLFTAIRMLVHQFCMTQS